MRRQTAAAGTPTEVSALVIEDDDDTRELFAELIIRAGFTVRAARNGREALELLRTIRPGVIIVDLNMPVMSGAEFRAQQRLHSAWLEIPTIVLTTTINEPRLDLAIEQTLRKPVPGPVLLDIIRRHAKRDQ